MSEKRKDKKDDLAKKLRDNLANRKAQLRGRKELDKEEESKDNS